MIKYCRSCGKELVLNSNKTCANCGDKAVKADAFCRYCGHTTNAQDLVCPNCGSALKPNTGKARIISSQINRWMKAGKVINLTLVVIGVGLYTVLTLPPKVTKPIQAAASDAVLATTGYTAAPGTTNRTASAVGKIPITVSINVSVLVTSVPIRMGGRLTQWPGGIPPTLEVQ